MMRRVFFAVFLVVACATGAAAGPAEDEFSAYQRFEDGFSAFQRGDYALATQLFCSSAEQGHAPAQLILGGMNAQGKVVPQNCQEAAKWYRKAAKQGYESAQFELGGMYDKRQGIPQDFVRAHMWYTVFVRGLGTRGLAMPNPGHQA